MLEIKKGIPVPTGGGRNSKYPFDSMTHGDCFDTEIKDGETEIEALRRMRTTCSVWRNRRGSSLKFVVRAELLPENRTVIRVWAVDPVFAG